MGRQFIVEMQMAWSEEFKSRVLFNASKAYVNQLEKGEDYKLLRPVYSLNLVNGIFEKDLPEHEYYHFYQLVHERHSEKVIEGLHILFVELPKFDPADWEAKKMRWLWMRFLTEINPSTKVAPAELFQDPIIGKAVFLMEESAMTETERYLYEKNLDSIRVERAIINEWHEKGWKRGKAEGLAEGKAEGEREKALKVARNLKAAGIDLSVIQSATGLSSDEIAAL